MEITLSNPANTQMDAHQPEERFDYTTAFASGEKNLC
jgi:hypothetical protein